MEAVQHSLLHLQEELADRKHQHQQQPQADNDLQLDIDGKHIDLGDDLHQNPHSQLADQLRRQDGHAQLHRQDGALDKEL